METEFETTGCPYIESETNIPGRRVIVHSMSDIRFQYVGFDQDKLLEFSHEYQEGVDLLSPDHNSSLFHVGKETYSEKKLCHSMTVGWEQIFNRAETDFEKILILMKCDIC